MGFPCVELQDDWQATYLSPHSEEYTASCRLAKQDGFSSVGCGSFPRPRAERANTSLGVANFTLGA